MCNTNGIALLYIVGNVRPALVNHACQALFRQKKRGCEAHWSASNNVEGLPAEILKLSISAERRVYTLETLKLSIVAEYTG